MIFLHQSSLGRLQWGFAYIQLMIVQPVWKHEMYKAVVFQYSNYGTISYGKKQSVNRNPRI
jgi:hypothetical protein